MWAIVDAKQPYAEVFYYVKDGALGELWTRNWCSALLLKTRVQAETAAFDLAAQSVELFGRLRIERIDRWVLVTTVGLGCEEGPVLSDKYRRSFFNEGRTSHIWTWGWENATHYVAWQDAGYMIPEALKVLPSLKGHIEVARLDRVYGL